MSKANTFSSRAWLLDGFIHSLPGILHLDNNRLTYLILDQGTFSDNRLRSLLETNGTASSTKDPAFPFPLFSVSQESISRFRIPWYYFGGGAQLILDGRSFRFSFVTPQNTVEPTYYSESFNQWRGGKGQEEVDIVEGRIAGKAWKRLLAR